MARRFRWYVWSSLLVLLTGVGLGVAWYANHRGETALPLDQAQREFLWEVEHHGLALNRLGFQPLAAALKQGDRAELAALFAADFTGQVSEHPREVRLDSPAVQVVRWEDDGPRQTLDRDQFVSRLLDYRARFSNKPRVSINLMTLTPQQRTNMNSPWEGTCLLRMVGEMGTDRPGEVILNLQYRVPRPTEENFDAGGWLHGATITQAQAGQAAHVLFKDVTAARGIDTSRFHDNWKCTKTDDILTNTGGVYLCDFDRDGILDMLIVDVRRFALYKGLRGGKFKDVTVAYGLPTAPRIAGNTAYAAFVDLDGDGWEDLILDGHIYRNVNGKKFVDRTSRSNLVLIPDAIGVALADYDGDGLVDIYVMRTGPAKSGSWLDGKSGDLMGNQLWRNLGNFQFENVTLPSGTAGNSRSTFSAVWLDANNDGKPDLYVINEFGNGVLLLNQGNGTFRQHLLTDGPGDFGSMGVTTGDVDGDGNIDLYIANMYSKAGSRIIKNLLPGTYDESIMETMRHFVTGSQMWLNRGNLRFDPMGKTWQVNAVGWAYGAALVDLDNDGWLDLYATCGFVSQSRDDPDG
jgi:hypothetical protein